MSKYQKEDNWGELTNCEESEFEGTKASSRPKVYCKPVTALSSSTVNGPFASTSTATLNETTVVPPRITVGGQTFVPMQVPLCVGINPGSPARDGEPAQGPSPIMQTYTLLVAASGNLPPG
jgi:hypothetical protein